jgi:hypothetical protein
VEDVWLFMAIWNILWLFGIDFHILVCCSKKNLATLVENWREKSAKRRSKTIL